MILLLIAILLLLMNLRSRESFETEPPVCPAGTILGEDNKCSSIEVLPFECPNGYQLNSKYECQRKNGTAIATAVCSGDYVFSTELGGCVTPPVDPSCPGDYTYKDGQCSKNVR